MAAIRGIIRAKGGTAQREVLIADITVADVRCSPLFLPDERWIAAVSRYYDDLCALLDAVRADAELPIEFFVPDLWSTANKLPGEEKELMLDVWHLGHDLAEGVGYSPSDSPDDVRNCVGGTVFVRKNIQG